MQSLYEYVKSLKQYVNGDIILKDTDFCRHEKEHL